MDSPMLSPTTGPRHHRRARFSCRRIDRICCNVLTYFPLLFVNGTTTWAAYTYSWSICWNAIAGLKGTILGLLGLVLYFLANWSYLAAVFTNPGSPLNNKHAYASLPTIEPTSISVKSSGQARFCKKCQCYKPDRTHHCSSCRTCVLKMDHHCPWLANCLGLYNYKSFLLFLIYTSLFCVLCFAVSCIHVYYELLSDTASARGKYSDDDLGPVNWVLLCVIAGIIGLVLGGFTTWHLMLVGAGMTTIESLEKARYTTPALSHRPLAPSGANHLYDNATNDPDYDYASAHAEEREHEFRRYNAYVLEESARKLPHPFNLGRARNFRAVFGRSEEWWLWFLPRFSGVGDGWNWETSAEWRVAAEKVRVERERMGVEQDERSTENRQPGQPWRGGNPNGLVKQAGGGEGRGEGGGSVNGANRPSKAERILGKAPGSYSDGENVPLQRMHRTTDSESDSEGEDNFREHPDLEIGLAIGRKPRMEARSAGSVSGGWGSWEREAERW